MKYIFIIICSIVLPICSLKKNISKFCINCKFFINNSIDNSHGKCSFFPKHDDNNADFLVTGIKNIDYTYCSTARKYDEMCGIEGKKYKRKISSPIKNKL